MILGDFASSSDGDDDDDGNHHGLLVLQDIEDGEQEEEEEEEEQEMDERDNDGGLQDFDNDEDEAASLQPAVQLEEGFEGEEEEQEEEEEEEDAEGDDVGGWDDDGDEEDGEEEEEEEDQGEDDDGITNAGGGGTSKGRSLRLVSHLAKWSVSSFKQGFGLENLLDSSTDTYWQSDGPQPHFINIQFSKKTTLKQLSLYLDFKQDESYTPNKISIRAGTCHHDLQDVLTKSLEVEDQVDGSMVGPSGWVHFPLCLNPETGEYLRAFLVQICIVSNHQDGKDTHVRLAKIYSQPL